MDGRRRGRRAALRTASRAAARGHRGGEEPRGALREPGWGGGRPRRRPGARPGDCRRAPSPRTVGSAGTALWRRGRPRRCAARHGLGRRRGCGRLPRIPPSLRPLPAAVTRVRAARRGLRLREFLRTFLRNSDRRPGLRPAAARHGDPATGPRLRATPPGPCQQALRRPLAPRAGLTGSRGGAAPLGRSVVLAPGRRWVSDSPLLGRRAVPSVPPGAAVGARSPSPDACIEGYFLLFRVIFSMLCARCGQKRRALVLGCTLELYSQTCTSRCLKWGLRWDEGADSVSSGCYFRNLEDFERSCVAFLKIINPVPGINQPLRGTDVRVLQ